MAEYVWYWPGTGHVTTLRCGGDVTELVRAPYVRCTEPRLVFGGVGVLRLRLVDGARFEYVAANRCGSCSCLVSTEQVLCQFDFTRPKTHVLRVALWSLYKISLAIEVAFIIRRCRQACACKPPGPP